MMAMDGLPLLRANETVMPAKVRPVAPGKAQASHGAKEEPSFEDTFRAEQNSERSPAQHRSLNPSEMSDTENPDKRSLREERTPEKSDTKRRMHPTSVRNDVVNPELGPSPLASVQGESEVPPLYRRPDFFEAPVDGSKMKSKVAVERFLTAMKTEVGVSPDQVIRAMKSLPSEAMAVSPEQNMHQILGALKLPANKQASAEMLFKGMVSQLGDTNVNQDIERYSPKLVERQAWLDSVDQISQRFFLRNQDPMAFAQSDVRLDSVGTPHMVSTSDEVSREPFGVVLAPTAASAGAGLGIFASMGATAGARASLSPQSTISPQDLGKQTQFGRQAAELNGEIESLEMGKGTIPLAKAEALVSTKEMGFTEIAPSAAAPAKPMGPHATLISKSVTPVSISALSMAGGGGPKPTEELAEEKVMADTEAPLAGASGQYRGEDSSEFAEALTAAAPSIHSRDSVENLRELNQSAARIAKDGGGEITMKLRPEGLGEVKLKVMVENGKVNVEMIADNPETKRILESQSFDLKKSLEGQMIHVDGLRIDVRDQQAQNERHSSQNQFDREMAKDFLGQFRDQNQSFRQSFFELPNVKAYRGTSKQAEEVRPNQAVRPRSDSSKRLNLVA